MDNIQYLDYHPQYETVLLDMVTAMYQEDPGPNEMTHQKIRNTIQHLDKHPDNGSIILFSQSTESRGVTSEKEIVGYAILVNFWSNDYGGYVVFIDELFVSTTHRSKSIGTRFLNHLINTNHNNAVALFLEVRPSNDRALSLYHKIGFKAIDNKVLKYELNV